MIGPHHRAIMVKRALLMLVTAVLIAVVSPLWMRSVGAAQALCQTASGFCQVTHPGVYELQVPAEWVASQTEDDEIDVAFLSVDGRTRLAITLTTGSDPNEHLRLWALELAESGLIRNVQVGNGGNSLPVVVPNASSAAMATAAYTGVVDDVPYVNAVMAATRGTTLVVVEFVTPGQSAEERQPQIDRVLRSLRLLE